MHVFQPVKYGEFVTTVAPASAVVLTTPGRPVFSSGTAGTTHECIANLDPKDTGISTNEKLINS